MTEGITEEKREALVSTILQQWLDRPRWARLWSLVGVVLSLAIMGILVSVHLEGGEGSDDVVVPAVIAAVLGLGCLGAFFYSHRWISDVRAHELIVALRSPQPPVGVEKTMVGGYMGLCFTLQGGGKHVLFFDAPTQEEFLAWLGN